MPIAKALIAGLTRGTNHCFPVGSQRELVNPKVFSRFRPGTRRHDHIQVEALRISPLAQQLALAASPIHRQGVHVIAVCSFLLFNQRARIPRFIAVGRQHVQCGNDAAVCILSHIEQIARVVNVMFSPAGIGVL